MPRKSKGEPKSAWRAAHGKAAKLGSLLVSETLPSDELSPATPADPAQPDRDSNGRFIRGNRSGKSKRLRVGVKGHLAHLEAQADAAWRAAMKWGRRYAAHRRAELAQLHGGEISAGVGALVESEGMLLASSRYWHARGMAENSADHCKLAATLEAQARGCKRDAWELAAREAAARPKLSAQQRNAADLALIRKQLAERDGK